LTFQTDRDGTLVMLRGNGPFIARGVSAHLGFDLLSASRATLVTSSASCSADSAKASKSLLLLLLLLPTSCRRRDEVVERHRVAIGGTSR
jgi:hypothetical protein